MTTYTAIPNGDIDQDSPVTQTLMTLLRDNPLAIQEGDATAPKIADAALSTSVTVAGTSWIRARMTQFNTGELATYALLVQESSTTTELFAGQLVLGSALRYSGLLIVGSTSVTLDSLGVSPAGTWRLMGNITTGVAVNGQRLSLFNRVI